MTFEPAIVWLAAGALVLVAVIIGSVSALRDRLAGGHEAWLQDLNELESRVSAMAAEITALEVQIGHLEELVSLEAEAKRLRRETQQLERDRMQMLDDLARIADLLGRRASPPGDAGRTRAS